MREAQALGPYLELISPQHKSQESSLVFSPDITAYTGACHFLPLATFSSSALHIREAGR